ncbi:MAG TPA: EAL domain-containing protein [Xanthobacteraceae bacterium]|jgi:diguanylate cyclase (GGDEF)-like protein|nr:EAL domain-containing protein [Xanthobacteraceae bacterium]
MATSPPTQFIARLRPFAPCFFAAAAGIGVSMAAASMTANWEDRRAQAQFHVVADNHFMIVQNGLTEYVNRLRAVRALFDSAEGQVSRSSFEAFTRPLLHDDGVIATLSWVPRVLGPERAAHEREGAQQGILNYHIKAMGEHGKMSASPERDEYYPIFYVTLPKASPLYGLDLRSEPQTLVELEQARDHDRLGFSAIQTLVSSGGTKSGFLFSLPVYRHGAPHETIDERRRNLSGFVHGSLLTSKMIDTIVSTNLPEGLDIHFFAPDAGVDAAPVYVHGSRLRREPAQPASQAELAKSLHVSRDLTADEQRWLTMVMVPMPAGPLTPAHDRAWLVLIAGLLITAAIVTYIQASRRHALRMTRVNRKFSDLAQTDTLTSLPNRRGFMKRIHAAFAAANRGAAPFAVLYFDLDHFKDVNDTLGHAVGDALLRQVAARVRGAIRENDVVARFGGDEFAILQSDVGGLDAAGVLAAKIGQILAEPYDIDGNTVHISASIGISRYAAEVAGPEAMMIQADLALYRAKEDGRNCYRFHNAGLDSQVQERVLIADELRGAHFRDELELYYQPQVDLRDGRIIGLEALLRWNHPKRGQIPPAVFIPIAERTGQVQLLGQWVLDAACRQLRAWLDEGIAPALVGVNFSALHFKASTDLDGEVAASLGKWDIAPNLVEIELTETVLMDITQQHNDRFERLRHLGVRIAVDDFGTGYSSLSYLANYPINRVKIAQELVAGVDTDTRSAAVVRAAIGLAQELGIQIIAEGVETEGQEKFLLSAGCVYGQGYRFGRPVAAAQATALLRVGSVKPVRKVLRLVETSAA